MAEKQNKKNISFLTEKKNRKEHYEERRKKRTLCTLRLWLDATVCAAWCLLDCLPDPVALGHPVHW